MQERISKPTHPVREKPQKTPLETRPLNTTPAKSEQNHSREDTETKLAPATPIDESQLDQEVIAELDEIDEVLKANSSFLGEVAIAQAKERKAREWEAWRAEYLGKLGLAA